MGRCWARIITYEEKNESTTPWECNRVPHGLPLVKKYDRIKIDLLEVKIKLVIQYKAENKFK